MTTTTSKIMICHIILCTTLVLHASLCSLVIAIDDKERSNGFQPRFRRNYVSLTAYKNIDKRIHYHDTRNLQPPKPKSKQQMRQKMKKNPHNTSSSINVSSTRTNDEKAGGGSKASTALTGTTHVYNTDTSMAQSSSTNVNSSSQESLRNATPIEKNLSVYMYALAASLVGIAIASVMIQQRRRHQNDDERTHPLTGSVAKRNKLFSFFEKKSTGDTRVTNSRTINQV